MKTKAFSLIEILVVIAILAILSAITFSVLSSSKESAYKVRETNQLSQIYLALNLYEADHDSQSPPSLVTLREGNYLPKGSLTNPDDVRKQIKLPNWPANPWVNSVEIGDDKELMGARYNEMNSYFYLRTFHSRFPRGRKYEEFRNDPNVGLISGVGLMKCGGNERVSGCDYYVKNPAVDSGQPATNLIGYILTVKTDGSVKVRKRPPPVSGEMSYEQIFLFYDLVGQTQSAGPG